MKYLHKSNFEIKEHMEEIVEEIGGNCEKNIMNKLRSDRAMKLEAIKVN